VNEEKTGCQLQEAYEKNQEVDSGRLKMADLKMADQEIET